MNQIDYTSYNAIDGLADTLPHGAERIALREKGINAADLSGDKRQQFDARKKFIEDVSDDGGFTEKYFTVFPWLLNYAQQSGSEDDKMMVLWYYKWVIGQMAEIPAVTKTQIERTLEDLRLRYLEFGSSEKVYHDYAASTYMYIGEHEKSKKHQQLWSKFKQRDYLDDCEACVINRQVDFHSKLSKLQKALKVGEPLLTGRLRCSHVPKTTYAHLLVPLMREHNETLAAEYAEKLYKALMSKKYGGDNVYASFLIIFFARQGDFARAIKLFERYMKLDVEQKNVYRRFHFFTGALYLFTKIELDDIKLKIPTKASFYRRDSNYNVASLVQLFDEQTNIIAAAFDKRNENTMMSDEKKKLLAL